MVKTRAGDAAIYGVIIGSSLAISIINLAGSLRVLDISGSPVYLSLSVTLYNLAFTLMSWSWTRIFVGRLNRRGILLLSLVGISISLLLLILGVGIYAVIIGNTLAGLFSALIYPVMITLLTDYLGRDSIAITKYNMASGVGLALGYLLGGTLRMVLGPEWVLISTLVVTVALIPLTLAIPQRYVIIEPRRISYVSLIPQFTGRLRPAPSVIFTPRIMYNFGKMIIGAKKILMSKLTRRMPLTLLGSTILFTGIALYFTPMPAYLRNLGFTDTFLYFTYLASTVVSILAYRPAHEKITSPEDAWKTLLLFTSSRILIFGATPLFTLMVNEVIVKVAGIALYVFIGLTWSFISSALPRVILSMSEFERREERLGHLNASIGVGTIIGSLISAYTLNLVGYEGTFIIASVLALISVITFMKAYRTLIT